MSTLLAFLGVSLVVIVTPGPDTAITIRNTLFGGRPGGMFTALGIASGQMIWALATGVGIVAVLIASEPLFLAVKYAGCAYLVYLGSQALRQALRPAGPANGVMPVSERARRLTRLTAFRQGAVSNLGNPKMAVFFASLLPQFVAPGAATFASIVLLGAIFAVMTFTWLALYAAFIVKAGAVLRQPPIRRAIEATTGALLIGLGLRLAADQH